MSDLTRKWSTAIGLILATLGLAFVGRAVTSDWHALQEAISAANWAWLFAGFLAGLLGMALAALGWSRTLTILGSEHPTALALRWYFVGQLGKYIPGGVWSVMGSSELASGWGVPRTRSYSAMLISLAALYLAGAFVVAAILPFQDILPLGRLWMVLIALALPVLLAGLHPALLRLWIGILGRLIGRKPDVVIPPWRDLVRLTIFHVPVWVGLGFATWCVAQALGVGAPVHEIVFAAVLAWVVGFLVIPAPGGLGIREAVFTLSAVSLDSGIAAAVALLARILFVMVDIVTALLVAPALPVSSPDHRVMDEEG